MTARPDPNATLLALARAAAVSRLADAREALRDLPNFDPSGRPVPRFYQLESFRTGTPAGWWRDVGVAPASLRGRIRKEPDCWCVVEVVSRPDAGPFAFRLSDLEAGK